jgi:phosphate transport system substrate-binding protein
MKKILWFILLGILLMMLAGCGGKNIDGSGDFDGVVKTGGSTSVEKVMTALIYQFQEDHRNVTVNYEMNGSGDGIKNTLSGLYEIGHSSRELKRDGSEDGLEAVAYAIDGIAIVVHVENNVKNLTQTQLRDIYNGKITNWKDVGGRDLLITTVTREAGSGTRNAFGEIVGVDKIVSTANVADSTGAVQTLVSQNPGAIGYMSFSDVDAAKVRCVEYEDTPITIGTLTDESYRLSRKYYLLTKRGAELSPAAQAFKDFVLSEEGQAIIAQKNLLPVR